MQSQISTPSTATILGIIQGGVIVVGVVVVVVIARRLHSEFNIVIPRKFRAHVTKELWGFK